jgi:branched-subunit amino acid transport protein
MDPARVAVIVVVGLACYLERALPQFLRAERFVRGGVATWLQYVSVAAIAGLGSSLAFPVGGISHPALGPRTAAILLAIAVAAVSRRPAWATVAGMAAYLALGGPG